MLVDHRPGVLLAASRICGGRSGAINVDHDEFPYFENYFSIGTAEVVISEKYGEILINLYENHGARASYVLTTRLRPIGGEVVWTHANSLFEVRS